MIGCQCCKVFEGVVVKALLCLIQAYAPLDLVHVDFTRIEITMELNQPPSIKNVLVLMDHFTRYAMAFITMDQKEKTIACILYEQFISVLVYQLKCSATEVRTSCLHLLKSSAQYLAFKNAGVPHTTRNAMDRWKDSTRRCSE